MEKINAPFTEEQAEKLKAWQSGFIEDPLSQFYTEEDGIEIHGYATHPFTCCGYEGCKRPAESNDGILIPSVDGLVCPCGKYKQGWCHNFMAE